MNALPINQSGRQIQCFECHQFGHKRVDYLNKNNKRNIPCHFLPLQNQVSQNQNRNQSKPTTSNLTKGTTANYISLKEQAKEQAQIYADLDPSGRNR